MLKVGFIFLFVALATSLSFGEPTRVYRTPSCSPALAQVAQQAMGFLGARGGRAIVGFQQELFQLLVGANETQPRAQELVAMLAYFDSISDQVPGLHDTIELMKEIVSQKGLLVCIVSNDCSLSAQAQNHLLFTGRGKEAIIVTPLSSHISAEDWCMNFLGSVANLAGERVIMEWLLAAYSLDHLKAGSADHYYYEFAPDYDGTFPPQPDAMKTGAGVAFMSLYRNLVVQSMYAHFHPSGATTNAAVLASAEYREMTQGRNAAEISPIVKDLGLTEANFFQVAEDLYRTMADTRQRAIGAN